MKLYLLTRVDDIGYDEVDEQLVRAESKQEARRLCEYGDEGKAPWQTAKIKVITRKGKAGVIIYSFRAG